MAGNTERFKAEIELNSKQAQNELKQLEDQQKRMMEQQKALYSSRSAQNHKLAADMQKDIDSVNYKIREQKKYIVGLSTSVKDLSSASYKELSSTVRALNKELRSGNIDRNSTQYKALAERIRACRAEMEKMNIATKNQPSLFNRVSEGLNKYQTVIAGVIGSIAGLTMTIRKCAEDYAEMDEQEVDVTKYTNLSKKEVEQLNEQFKKMDTRTGRDQLNQLADEAGRLGIQTQKGALDFVDAADKINVALKDDLGPDAVGQIGKMAMAFGEDKKHGLSKAMLATGSVVNELSQSSSANGGYLVEFAARLAGVGKQAWLTIPQIMSFGSVLDQNMQDVEVSATSLNQLITAMFKDPGKFARLAGIDVKKFTSMLKTDANQALLQFFATMKNTGGFDKLAPMFDQMGLSGSRSVQVLSVLANKLGDITQAENIANNAYSTGNSVLNEFRRSNESAQAQLDKAKKHFKDLSIELGEQLMPVVKYTISGASLLVHALSVIAPWLRNNIGLIAKLALVIGAYTVATKIAVNWEKIRTVWQAKSTLLDKTQTLMVNAKTIAVNLYRLAVATLKRDTVAMTAAQNALNSATKANPWGLLAAAIVAAGVAIYSLIKKYNSLKEAAKEATVTWQTQVAVQKDQKKINDAVAESTAEEKTRIAELSKIIHSNVYSIGERRSAINALQKIVPAYHASISSEGKLYNENVVAIQNYIAELNAAAVAEAIYERKTQINKQKMELEFKKSRKENNIKAVDAEMQIHPQKYKSQKATYMSGNAWGGFTYVTGEANTYRTRKLDERKVHETAINNIKKQEQVLDNENRWLDNYAKRQKGVQEKLNKKYTKTGNGKDTQTVTPQGGKPTRNTKEGSTNIQRERKTADKEAEKERKEELKKSVNAAKAEYSAEMAEAMTGYRTGASTYSDYLEDKQNITTNYYDKLKEIYGKDSNEYKKLLDDKARADQEYQEDQNDLAKQNNELQHLQMQEAIKRQYYDKGNKDAYQNEDVKNEALFQEDIRYIEAQQKLYGQGSKEWHNLELEKTKEQTEHQFQLQEDYEKRLQEYRKEMGQVSLKDQEDIELKGVRVLFETLSKTSSMTKDEYDRIVQHIREKYAELEGQQNVDNNIKNKAAAKLQIAKNMAAAEDSTPDNKSTGGITAIIRQQKQVNEILKQLYGEDYENNAEYQEAKKQLNEETTQKIVAEAQSAMDGINNILGAASSYAQACSELETTRITNDYQKQIDAAGNNSKKKEQLEKKRDKEIALAKSKANKKAMKIEVAQALASTAMAAINAYASASKTNWVLGPIAAAMATAAGMLQIATIKKQQQVEAAGYYQGGFTKGNQYRHEAGVVHEGEFVANHEAVRNSQLRPVFSLIDIAQKNNRVASLTSADVSRSIGRGDATVVAPIVNVQNDNQEEVKHSIDNLNEVIDILQARLNAGIEAKVNMEQMDKEYQHFKILKGNAK
ncbi:MAG: phage tail tape measure protein [Prevotella sp.]|jgi:TP901 family phage tail tape measure protein|nr:phage tail tape measure protein [Prevotella sp.]MCH3994167.1 phage tail tape measure protein [Prevotella sp.]